MTSKNMYRQLHASACAGGSCAVDRRSLLKGAAALGGGLMIGGVPAGRIFAQTPVSGSTEPIPRLNGGGMGGGTNPQPQFNPFIPNAISGTTGLLFEPLVFINSYNCEHVPWLAESYEWSDPQNLVFTLREGVTWNDGTEFTGEDVAFTFTMLMENAAMDLSGSTVGLESVAAEGNQVTFTFEIPSIPQFNPVAINVIVPKHIWEGVDDPLTFVNEESPVGTGPFTMNNFNSEEVVWAKNENYWAADEIFVQEIGFTKPAEGQADMLRLANGEYDWNAKFIPNVDEVYVSRDPEHNHYWYAPGGNISLYFNLTKEPFNDVNFRKAVAHAINRDEIAEKAQLGYVETASQTGIKLPGQEAWLNPDIPNEGRIPYDPDTARQILEENGYTDVEFTFKVPAGWTDWIQAANIVASNLSDVGITANVETPDATILNDQDRKTGNFDLVFGVHGGGCSMFRNFYDHLSSEMTAPVGEDATSNFVRWEDEKTDELLAQFLSAETEDVQKEIAYQLQTIMYEQFPTIPLWYGAIWFQYRTENAVGWPNEEDPYAGSGDLPLILRRLRAPEA